MPHASTTQCISSSTPRHLLRRLIGIAGAVSALFVGVGQAVDQQPAAAQTGVATYQITIAGTASGNPFRLGGLFVVAPRVTSVTTNGLNPFETCVRVGYPAATPQTGAIWYGSNTACFSSRGQNIDLVYANANANGSAYATQPDGRLQATYSNNWTARGGITACLYSPASGSTSYNITGSNVSGTIQLQGYGGAFCGNSTYIAQFNGVRI